MRLSRKRNEEPRRGERKAGGSQQESGEEWLRAGVEWRPRRQDRENEGEAMPRN